MLVTLPVILLLLTSGLQRMVVRPGSRAPTPSTHSRARRDGSASRSCALRPGSGRRGRRCSSSGVSGVGTLSQLSLDYRLATRALLPAVRMDDGVARGTGVFYPYRRRCRPVQVSGPRSAGAVTVAAIRATARRPYLLVGWLWYSSRCSRSSGCFSRRSAHAIGSLTFRSSGCSSSSRGRSGACRKPAAAAAGFGCRRLLMVAAAQRRPPPGSTLRNSETLWRRALASPRPSPCARGPGVGARERGQIGRCDCQYRERCVCASHAEWATTSVSCTRGRTG